MNNMGNQKGCVGPKKMYVTEGGGGGGGGGDF